MNTPETDHEERRIRSDIRILFQLELPTMADFARQLERERDELREALSGRTVSCSRCNEAGYKLAGFEAEVAGLRAENEDLRDEARNAIHLAESAAAAAFNERDRLVREMAAMREAIREAALALAYVSNFEECRIFCADSMDIASHAAPMCAEALAKLKPFITP